MNRGQLIKLIIICSIIVSSLSLSGCVDNNNNGNNEISDDDWREWPIIQSPIEQWSGYSSENSDEVVIINITEKYVTNLTVELKWSDEEPSSNRYYNQPDHFNITIITPWEQIICSEVGFEHIIVTIQVPEEVIETNGTVGEWIVYIHCGECGDQEYIIGSIGAINIEDTGNDWELIYVYRYHSNE